MDMSVRTELDQFPTSQSDSQMSRSGMYINTDPEGSFRRHEVSLNDDVESSVEK
jgi:hypothetical protein